MDVLVLGREMISPELCQCQQCGHHAGAVMRGLVQRLRTADQKIVVA